MKKTKILVVMADDDRELVVKITGIRSLRYNT